MGLRYRTFKKEYILIMLFCALFMGIVSYNFCVMFATLLSFILCYSFRKIVKLPKSVDKCITLCIVIGLLAVIIVYFGYYVDYGEPYWVPGQDDFTLENDAFNAAKNNFWVISDFKNGSTVREILHNSKAFVLYLAYIIRVSEYIGGYHTFIPRILNIMFLNMTALMMTSYVFKYRNFSEYSLKKTYKFLALLPNTVFLGAHIYRDTMTAFMLVLAFYLVIELLYSTRANKLCIIVFLLADIYIDYYFRKESLVFILLTIIAAIYTKTDKVSGRNKAKDWIKILAFVVIVIVGCLFIGNILSRFDSYLVKYSEDSVTSGSKIMSKVSSIPLFPIGLFLRIVAYVISPFYSVVVNPLEWFASFTNLFYVIVSMGTIYIISQYIYLFYSVKKDKQLTLIVVGLISMISITTLGFRHALMLYPFLIPLMLEGKFIAKRNSYQGAKQISYIVPWVFLVGFACVYYMM